MKVPKETYMRWADGLVKHYQYSEPFEEERLIVDTLRLSSPIRLYRVLCACAYLGKNNLFCDGILTRDILRVTGWEMPDKATASQIRQDEIISQKLERKCRKYISNKTLAKLIKNEGLELPVEWRTFYVMYVPRTAFTTEELSFMEKNPCWMLPLSDDPPLLEKEGNDA